MKLIHPSQLLEPLKALYKQGLKPGCSTGWPSLDRHWTVGKSQLTVITGIPNHGKSAWLDALIVNLLDIPLYGKKWRFLICSPEQEPLEIHQAEILERVIGSTFRHGSKDRMTWEQAEKAVRQKLDTRITFLHLEANDTFANLLNTVHDVTTQDPSSQWGVVLDPWNRLEHRRPDSMNESEYISEALSAAIHTKNVSGAHLFIVAHPTKLYRDKNGERPIPTPYDISGAAHWYNKPDNNITVWRNPQADPPLDSQTQIHIQKVRWKHIGKAGSYVTLDYDVRNGRYSDPSHKPIDYRPESTHHVD